MELSVAPSKLGSMYSSSTTYVKFRLGKDLWRIQWPCCLGERECWPKWWIRPGGIVVYPRLSKCILEKATTEANTPTAVLAKPVVPAIAPADSVTAIAASVLNPLRDSPPFAIAEANIKGTAAPAVTIAPMMESITEEMRVNISRVALLVPPTWHCQVLGVSFLMLKL